MNFIQKFFWKIEFDAKMTKTLENLQAWIIHYEREFGEPPIDVRKLQKHNGVDTNC